MLNVVILFLLIIIIVVIVTMFFHFQSSIAQLNVSPGSIQNPSIFFGDTGTGFSSNDGKISISTHP